MNKKQLIVSRIIIYSDIIAIFLTLLIILVIDLLFIAFLKKYPDMLVVSMRDWQSIDTLKNGTFIFINIILFVFLYLLMRCIVDKIIEKFKNKK